MLATNSFPWTHLGPKNKITRRRQRARDSVHPTFGRKRKDDEPIRRKTFGPGSSSLSLGDGLVTSLFPFQSLFHEKRLRKKKGSNRRHLHTGKTQPTKMEDEKEMSAGSLTCGAVRRWLPTAIEPGKAFNLVVTNRLRLRDLARRM